MSIKDFQNGFALGLTTGGVVESGDNSKVAYLVNRIDESGVLESADGTPADKVNELIYKSEIHNWFHESFVSTNYINSIFKRKDLITYVPSLDLSAITNASELFYECNGIETIGDLDLRNVTTLKHAFYDCDNLITVGKLKTDNCTDFSSTFYYSRKLVEIGALNTQNGTKFDYMFNSCRSLVTIPELDLSNAVSVGYMFDGCVALTNLSFTPDTIGVHNTGYELNIPCPNLSSDSLLSLLNGCAYASEVSIIIDSSLYDKFRDEHWAIIEEKQINIS